MEMMRPDETDVSDMTLLHAINKDATVFDSRELN